jgi:hypothetical protein
MLAVHFQNAPYFHIPTFQQWQLRGCDPCGPLESSPEWGSGRAFPAHGLSVCRALVEEAVAVASGAAAGDDGGASGRPLTKAQPGHRSYNLQERRRIGSMTGVEQALLPQVPTDESEAQTLATADLDLMKSEC